MKFVVVCLCIAAGTSSADTRPDGWLFRALPGAGYVVDAGQVCHLEGVLYAVGLEGGAFISERVLVGGAANVAFHRMDPNGCGSDGGGMDARNVVIGPAVAVYPFDNGFHISASGGFAIWQQEPSADDRTDRGVGVVIGAGYELPVLRSASGDTFRLGFAIRATYAHVSEGHDTLMPALLASLSVD